MLVTFADKKVFFFFQQNIFYCTLTKVCCDWCTIICSQKWLDIDQMHFSPFSFSPFFKLCCFDNRKKKKIPVVRENIAFLEQNISSSFLQQIWKASLKCFFFVNRKKFTNPKKNVWIRKNGNIVDLVKLYYHKKLENKNFFFFAHWNENYRIVS